ncbi:MAG: SDR family oxidoreductase [Micromonosporaceae bacterium]
MRRITVITGGGRGIGAATARRLAADGHDVVVGYLRDRTAAEAVAESVVAAGRRCLAVQVDTTVEADVVRLFATAAAELGPVTGLVNNAGVTSPLGRLADLTYADLRRVVDVNVIGAVLCAREAVRAMTASGVRPPGGAAIVNVSSSAATLGAPDEYVHYAASKAAVEALTVGLAKEVAAEGIRVNAVAPGTVRTDLHALSSRDPGRVDRVGPTTPLGRAGEPDEIAAAIAWLLSPQASYTTGAVLRVAGGR